MSVYPFFIFLTVHWSVAGAILHSLHGATIVKLNGNTFPGGVHEHKVAPILGVQAAVANVLSIRPARKI